MCGRRLSSHNVRPTWRGFLIPQSSEKSATPTPTVNGNLPSRAEYVTWAPAREAAPIRTRNNNGRTNDFHRMMQHHQRNPHNNTEREALPIGKLSGASAT